MRYLMTCSLLNSWLYLIKPNDFDTENKAEADFLRTLNRERSEPNEAMQRGIDFEELVERICEDIPLGIDNPAFETDNCPTRANGLPAPSTIYDRPVWAKWINAAEKAAEIVKGGQWQVKNKKDVVIDGVAFLLYGRIDVLKAGTIYDVKFTKNYDVGKFIGSTQHPMYFAITPGALDFSYLVSNGTNVWLETYTPEVTQPIEKTVREFMQWLKTRPEWEKIYFEKWCSNGNS